MYNSMKFHKYHHISRGPPREPRDDNLRLRDKILLCCLEKKRKVSSLPGSIVNKVDMVLKIVGSSQLIEIS